MSLLLNISLRSQLIGKRPVICTIVKRCLGVRNFSSNLIPSVEEKSEQGPEKTFKEIYRFSYIKLGHSVNKIKWPQTLLVAFVLPNTAALYFGGLIDFDLLIGIFLPAAVITGNVYAYGSCFHDAVGFMYLSEDDTTLKISYLDFWGNRVNKEVPVDDVVPLTEVVPSPIDYFYRTISFYSTDKLKLKLYLKTGAKIADADKFVKVFGDYTKY